MSAQILVIEDDEDLRIKIEEFFIRQCHRPAGRCTLAEAAAALETMTPDAVLSDINFPDGDGMNFCLSNAARIPAAMWLLMFGNADLLRLGSQLKGTDDEKPVLLRLLDRFTSVGAASAPEPTVAVLATAAS